MHPAEKHHFLSLLNMMEQSIGAMRTAVMLMDQGQAEARSPAPVSSPANSEYCNPKEEELLDTLFQRAQEQR